MNWFADTLGIAKETSAETGLQGSPAPMKKNNQSVKRTAGASAYLCVNLPIIEEALNEGSTVVFIEQNRIRIIALPINP